MGRHASVVKVYGADISRSDALRLSDAMSERLKQLGVDRAQIEEALECDLGLSDLMAAHVDPAWSGFGMHGHGAHGGVQHTTWSGSSNYDDELDIYSVGFKFYGQHPTADQRQAWERAVSSFLDELGLGSTANELSVAQIL